MNVRAFNTVASFFTLALVHAAAIATPPGFTDEAVPMDLATPVGVTFAPSGLGFIWEQNGRVWSFENGVRSPQPVLNLQEETGFWADYGLLGFALDPNFLSNGLIYTSYVVDYYYLTHFGLPDYDASLDTPHHDTIGRITRYHCTFDGSHWHADPASRTILLGETISTGVPICSDTHGVGSLVFGSDGTLLASCGDGAGVTEPDGGGFNRESSNTALADGILRPKEDVGAFRAQMIDSLNGKILRIDPATGNGVPGNPFFDAAHPRSPQSRVFNLGVRNPYRMCRKPGTGSSDPALGLPGLFTFGDVGWYTFEELNIFDRGGRNFGWPLFEGLEPSPSYPALPIRNPDAPNPASGGTCNPIFRFSDLLTQDSLNTPQWLNPCNNTPITNVPTFVHTRPALDWGRTGLMRTPTFAPDGSASVCSLGTCVPGTPLHGSCAVGGAWYTDNRFPAPYRNTYFHGDFTGRWLLNIVFDENNHITEVRQFSTSVGMIVSCAVNPVDGALYYLTFQHADLPGLRRIAASPNGAPIVQLSADRVFGASPLTVNFSSAGTSDPDQDHLSYLWDFGDGSPPSTDANPSHTFTAPSSAPIGYTVTLTVTDEFNHATSRRLGIYPNDTPPIVVINSPFDGFRYPVDVPLNLHLSASATDAETPASLTSTWQAFLHHNEHFHADAPLDGTQADITLTPYGCGIDHYYYELRFTCTDPQGLSTAQSVFVHPDCCDGDFNHDASLDFFDYLDFVDAFAAMDPLGDFNEDGSIDFFDYLDFVDAFSRGC